MMTHDEMIAVIQHHKDGGEVQVKDGFNKNSEWENTMSPLWNFGDFNYRPKPMLIYIQVFDDNSVRYCGTQKPPYNPSITVKKFIEVTD